MYRTLGSLLAGAALVMTGCGNDREANGRSATRTMATSTAVTTEAGVASREEDEQRAADAMLSSPDLGPQWEGYAVAEDRIVSAEVDCLTFEDTGLVETANYGAAFTAGNPTLLVAGKVFSRSSHAALSSIKIYETDADAETAFTRFSRALKSRSVLRCFLSADTVRKGPRMAEIQSYYYRIGDTFPEITEHTWAEQYEMRIAKKGGTVWIDVVVMQEERALGLVFFSSLEVEGLSEPISDEFVKRMAQVMGKRMSH